MTAPIGSCNAKEEPMPLHLPEPIRIYFASENTHDTKTLKDCFAIDAFVRDEGLRIEGLAAITAWRTETGRKYGHTVEPLGLFERDGKTVVTTKVTGNFPGSPVTLDHIFGLDGDRIASLEIR